MEEAIASCEWASSHFFIISENVFSPLIYYSHLLPVLLSLPLALYIFFQNRKSLQNKALLVLVLLFSLWSVFDLVLWANEKPPLIVFFWSLEILIEPLIFISGLYLLYVFVTRRDMTLQMKALLFIVALPIILLTPTNNAIISFNLTNCDREVIEGPLVYMGYLVQILMVLWIITRGIIGFRATREKDFRRQILLMTLGLLFFLVTFSIGNIIGSFSENWTIGQYGLFGMPVFVAIVAYISVKYKTFSSKLIAPQVLVAGVLILLCSLLFLENLGVMKKLIWITLVLVSGLGYYLVRSMWVEIRSRKEIERLASELQEANDKLRELDQLKSEFISLASHQIRSPLTAIKGYSSLILEGDYGEISNPVRGIVKTIFDSCESLVIIVNEFLDISRIEQGRMRYDKTEFDMLPMVKETIGQLLPNIEHAGLHMEFNSKNEAYFIYADRNKMKQIVSNLIDNAIKYTPKGGITAGLSKQNGKILFSLKDTGVGVDPMEKEKLFGKFTRAHDANKTNVSGTGLGLYVAKQMVEAMGGRIWVDSEGKGKGSTFNVEMLEAV